MANAISVRFRGHGEINKTFSALSLKGQSIAKAIVGYNVPYAARVHEDLEMFHPVGESKFLEKAWKRHIDEAREEVKIYLLRKKGLLLAIRKGGELILRKSNEMVPVDTGALKASGYVKVI